MEKTAMLEDAIIIAAAAHKGQKDKAGAPYILHPLRLMLQMKTEKEMIVAVLHDVAEDSEWTVEQLREHGFSEEVLTAVECLTRRENESYESFIERLKGNPIACQVKRADLEDNMNIRRIRNLTDNDTRRLKKYHHAWQVLARKSDKDG